MTSLEELIKLLKKLPSFGDKSATRLAYYLIKSDNSFNIRLGEAIKTIQDKIKPCPVCGAYMEGDECPYCSSTKVDNSLLCVVEEAQDVVMISSLGVYNGLYHVLGGVINPLEGKGPSSLRMKELEERVKTGSFREIIIATNPTEEGDTTALYIKKILSPFDVTFSRLASGIPIGGDLGYTDKTTLMRSMRGRIKI